MNPENVSSWSKGLHFSSFLPNACKAYTVNIYIWAAELTYEYLNLC